MTTIRECMARGAETIQADASLAEAVSRMKEKDIGMLPVVENDKMIGTITDRDIALCAFTAKDKQPLEYVVRDAMSEGVRWCFEDQSLDDAAQVMNEAQIRRLPVVDRNKRLVGTLGLRDIVMDGDAQKAVGILRGVLR